MDTFREIWAEFAFKDFDGHPVFNDNRDFYSETVQAQKEWIDEVLDNFLRRKIKEADSKYTIYEGLNVVQLVDIASRYYNKEAIYNLVHFILNIVGNMQGMSVVWTCNEKVDKFLIEYIDSKWDTLKTSEDVNSVEIFK